MAKNETGVYNANPNDKIPNPKKKQASVFCHLSLVI
jgi:hypothetical protein